MAKKKDEPNVLDSLIDGFGLNIPEEWVPAWMLVRLKDSVLRLRQAENIAKALADHVSVMAPIFDLLGHVNLTLRIQQRLLKSAEGERSAEIRRGLMEAAKEEGKKPPTVDAVNAAIQADEVLTRQRVQVDSLEALKFYLLEQKTIVLERGATTRERSTNLRVHQRADAGAV